MCADWQRSAKLTSDERIASTLTYNLADGHARYVFPEFWRQLRTVDPDHLDSVHPTIFENRLIGLYLRLLGQSASSMNRTRILPSASLSLELIANVLRLERKSLVAPDPCFDNLPDIFRRHEIPLVPYCVDDEIVDTSIAALGRTANCALLLVLPNNPSGKSVTKAEFEALVEYCDAHRVTIVVDASFRIFDRELCMWDMYGILESSSASYGVIEDTGKFLATRELKASLLTVDSSIEQMVGAVYDDMLIGHSPVVLAVLSGILEGFKSKQVERIRDMAAANRAALTRYVEPYLSCSPGDTPVAWLKIHAPVSDLEVVRELANAGVGILAGSKFYWSSPTAGMRRLRVALMRDPGYFETASAIIGNVVAARFSSTP